MKLHRDSLTLWTVLAAIVPAAFYFVTLCPTVYCGDAGELALAAAKLQIAHPPGYPLLTNVGHIWTLILFFLRPILSLNLLAAIFAAVAAAFLFRLLDFFDEARSNTSRAISLVLAITFALGQTLWSVATGFEVYSLSALLAVAAMALSIRFYSTGERRFLFLAAYVLGLSLCNHLSAGSVGVMLVIFCWTRRDDLRVRDWLLAAILLALPLTFYGYLYFRSSADLIVDWYDPQTLWGLKQHIFAKTYQRYLAAFHWGDLIPYFTGLVRLLSREFVLPFVILALPGLWLQFRRDRVLAVALLSVVVVNCGLNFNYLIPDITPYFLPTLLVAVIWMAESYRWLAGLGKRWSVVAVVMAAAMTIVTVAGNFARCDISDRRCAEDYAKDLFERVPQGGTLFCGSDNSMFPTLYLRYVEGYRSDCKVYGHLPTLVRLRNDLGLKATPGYNKFPDLVRYALTHATAPLTFAREPMQSTNDFRTLEPGLFADGLVYYADTTYRVASGRQHLDWRRLPKLYDQKEATLYVVYYLINGEKLAKLGDPQGERLLSKACEIVKAQDNFAMTNELSGYFVLLGNLRLARRTLEDGLSMSQLRFEQRMRLLESLGSVVMEMGDEKRAKEIFAEVKQLQPSSDVARYHLLAIDAGEAVRARRPTEAIAAYRQMLEIFPQQREVNLQLGILLLQTGDTAAARSMFDICLRDNYRAEYVRGLLK